MLPLSHLEVLVIDCQATAAAPRGRLLEIAWARALDAVTDARAHLIRLPPGEAIPPAVSRITGISEPMLQDGADADRAWHELACDAARFAPQPAPTIIHFARFERPFLRCLAAGEPALDIVCTHEIACRLLPDLPRRGLRALVGYLGGGLGVLRRSADHVEATAFVWRRLVPRLEMEGVATWAALRDWLATSARRPRRSGRVWPMPREARLSLPDRPGVYRMLRSSGDVLYVGKAASLHHRVNSYFRKRHHGDERMLEMLTQARAISVEVTATPLEAALLEADEIKRRRPPYNLALALGERVLWFASPTLDVRSPRPSASCPLGPFLSVETLDQFEALARADQAALASGRWGPDPDTFAAGYARFAAEHPELSHAGISPHARLLRAGTRLWREGRRDRDLEDESTGGAERLVAVWTPELVQLSLERLALRAALARRRAMWLTRLVDASVTWREAGAGAPRLLVVEAGEIVCTGHADPGGTPPVPPGFQRSVAARRELFTVASFDRLRVLTTELKRLVTAGASVSVRFGRGPALADARLRAGLWWM